MSTNYKFEFFSWKQIIKLTFCHKCNLIYIRSFHIEWFYAARAVSRISRKHFSDTVVLMKKQIFTLEKSNIKASPYFPISHEKIFQFRNRKYLYCSIFLHFYKYISSRALFYDRVILEEIKKWKRIKLETWIYKGKGITKEANTSYPSKASRTSYNIYTSELRNIDLASFKKRKNFCSEFWRLISGKFYHLLSYTLPVTQQEYFSTSTNSI